MDFRERVTPPHCRLQLWFALVGFLIPWSQAGKPCELRPEQFRSSLVLQGVQFDGAYALSLHEGLDCLREITTPRGPVNQSLNAIADFYEQFYAFRYICIDPPASSQSQAAPFDFGVYGSPRGGGSSAKDAKIDIWFLRSNSLFTRLRDAHVDWRNGGTKADTVLNQFIFILQNDATTSPVRMEVSARSAAAVDGFADPRFSCDGMEIESIDGMKPMQWLQLHVLENPAFHYAYKSLGSRANRMLKSARVGFAWLGSRVGDVSSLTPSVEVRFKNGQTTTWSWTWLLLTRSLNACKKYDVNCVLDLLKIHSDRAFLYVIQHFTLPPRWEPQGPLKAAGTLHQNAVEALGQLQKAHQHDELVNAAPELPDDEMMKLLKEESGLRSFLKIPEERIPGTQAHYRAMPALDEASFPRRWLLDPALSPLGATYGYYQLQRDESGELFAVVKLTRFYLTEDESAGFQRVMEVQKVKEHQENMLKEVYDLSRTTSALSKREVEVDESEKLRAELAAVEEARKKARNFGEDLLEDACDRDMMALDNISGLCDEDRGTRKATLSGLEALEDVDTAKSRLAMLHRQLEGKLQKAEAAAAKRRAAEDVKRLKAAAEAARAAAAKEAAAKEAAAKEAAAKEAAAKEAAANEEAPDAAEEAPLPSARRRAKEGQKAAASVLEPPPPGKSVWEKVRLPLRFNSREDPDSEPANREVQNNYVISATVPGLDLDDLKLELGESSTLRVEGLRTPSSEEATLMRRRIAQKIRQIAKTSPEKFAMLVKAIPQVSEDAYIELGQGEFGRFAETFRLPRDVDVENIDASYRDGVLQIVLPKIQRQLPDQLARGRNLGRGPLRREMHPGLGQGAAGPWGGALFGGHDDFFRW
eukprot:g3659.t1